MSPFLFEQLQYAVIKLYYNFQQAFVANTNDLSLKLREKLLILDSLT